MNFLMSNIVDRVDNMTGTMADWFTFISQLSLGDCQPTDPWSQFYVTDGESGEETVGDWYEYIDISSCERDNEVWCQVVCGEDLSQARSLQD